MKTSPGRKAFQDGEFVVAEIGPLAGDDPAVQDAAARVVNTVAAIKGAPEADRLLVLDILGLPDVPEVAELRGAADPGKRCPRCKVPRPRSAFYRSQDRPDGLSPWCRPCHDSIGFRRAS